MKMTRTEWRRIAQEAQRLVQRGEKVAAIKVIKNATNCSLKDAYDAATELQRMKPVRL